MLNSSSRSSENTNTRKNITQVVLLCVFAPLILAFVGATGGLIWGLGHYSEQQNDSQPLIDAMYGGIGGTAVGYGLEIVIGIAVLLARCVSQANASVNTETEQYGHHPSITFTPTHSANTRTPLLVEEGAHTQETTITANHTPEYV